MNRHLDGRFRCSPNLLVTPKDTIGGCLWKDGIWPKIENTLKSKKTEMYSLYSIQTSIWFHLQEIHRIFALYKCSSTTHSSKSFPDSVSLEIEPPETSLNLFRELSLKQGIPPKNNKKWRKLNKIVGKSLKDCWVNTSPFTMRVNPIINNKKPSPHSYQPHPPAPPAPAPGPQSWAVSISRRPSVPWLPLPRPCRAPLPAFAVAKASMEMVGKSGKATKMQTDVGVIHDDTWYIHDDTWTKVRLEKTQ